MMETEIVKVVHRLSEATNQNLENIYQRIEKLEAELTFLKKEPRKSLAQRLKEKNI